MRGITRFGKEKRILRATILVVSVIFIIALLTLLFSFIFSNATIRSLSDRNAQHVKTVESSTSIIYDLLIDQGIQIFYSSDVVKLRTSTKLSNFEVVEGVRALNSMVSIGSFIDSIYIYNSAFNFCFSSSENVSSSDHEDTFRDREAIELFKNYSSEIALKPIYREVYNVRKKQVMPIYSYVIADQSSGMMINIEASRFNSILFGSDLDAFILDENNDLLAWQQGISMELIESVRTQLDEEEESSGFFILGDDHFSLNKKDDRMICFYSHLTSNDWTLIDVVDYESVLGNMTELRNLVLLLLGIIFISILIVSIFVYIIIALPYFKITESIKGFEKKEKLKGSEIVQRLNELISTSRNAEHLQSTIDAMLKNETLYGVITGNSDFNLSQIADYNLSIDPLEKIDLVLVSTVNSEACIKSAKECGIEKIEGAVIGENTVLLIQCEDREKIENTIGVIMRNRPNYYIVTSNSIDNIYSLHSKYEELLRTYSRRVFHPEVHRLDTEILKTLSEDISDVEEKIKELSGIIRSGNLPLTQSKLSELFSLIDGKTYQSAIVAYHNVHTALVKLSSAEGESIGSIKDFDAFRIEIYDFAQKLVQVAQESKSHSAFEINSKIREMVEKEYANPLLSSQYIADSLSVSCAYLCRKWRKITGKSLAFYISRVRVDHSIELLEDSNMNIKEIAASSGFVNQQYFFTIFKNIVGCTPAEYRKRSVG
ncbi:MAG: helix-turn-helix transcriptional regulator [Sphaerochaetaceae bacterium]|nr:helix-turn-helix transcriptional regulator [Sphaerochaetaceae bacterium]